MQHQPNGDDTTVATITRRERDLLRSEVNSLLVGDAPSFLLEHDANDRDRLATIVSTTSTYIAIVDQLGWDAEGDPRDSYEITMPGFADVVSGIRDQLREELAYEREHLPHVERGEDGYLYVGHTQQESVGMLRRYIARLERTLGACDAILERMES